jgi:hypothetical protein
LATHTLYSQPGGRPGQYLAQIVGDTPLRQPQEIKTRTVYHFRHLTRLTCHQLVVTPGTDRAPATRRPSSTHIPTSLADTCSCVRPPSEFDSSINVEKHPEVHTCFKTAHNSSSSDHSEQRAETDRALNRTEVRKMLGMRQLRAVLCIALLVCSCMQLANARQLKQGRLVS